MCFSVCVCEQHLQEGRKAQQYLDHCFKQMENVSVEAVGRRSVQCKYSVLATGFVSYLFVGRMREMLTKVTKRQSHEEIDFLPDLIWQRFSQHIGRLYTFPIQMVVRGFS